MAPLGPFEAKPQLAVAVSGGADSLALALLANAWARRAGGSVTALTVDHGLRPEAAHEARQVKSWLARRRIPHRTLRWREKKPSANFQAAAREARYRLLEEWCRRSGVLHLLLAHHRTDQAETFLLRLGRGSGVDGLAAMTPVTDRDHLRLLRPLLPISHERMRATLEAFGQHWIEDPTNESPLYARVRLRVLLPVLAREGLEAERLAGTATRLARARAALESWTDRLLAQAVMLDPSGYATLDVVPYRHAPVDVALRALGRILRTIGGHNYNPRLERLERLHGEILAGLPAARTLGGCRVLRAQKKIAEQILLCREPTKVKGDLPVRAGATYRWDNRFTVTLGTGGLSLRQELRLGCLGDSGWVELTVEAPEVRNIAIPVMVRPSLPALRDLDGLLAVPHLCYGRDGAGTGTLYVRRLAFHPLRPLASGPITFA